MIVLTMPTDTKPRLEDFELVGLLDETLREGAERCPFSVPAEEKIALAKRILRTGMKDIIFGSGIEDVDNIARLAAAMEREPGVAPDWSATFILLLNCWEPVHERFRRFPRGAMNRLVVSFAMLDHQADRQLFERVVDKFRALGVTRFRVSLINSFRRGVDERKYEDLTRQIDRSVAAGIKVVRINDSLGEIFPETVAILAANLTRQYRDVGFCLHAHDDKGLGLQNALASVYYGFDHVEAAFSGFGNRSGLAAIEVLNDIFAEKNIAIRGLSFDRRALIETGREVERTFFAVPNVYRAVSGQIVNWENLGVANIPDYLGADRDARRFLNDVGLHPRTVEGLIGDGSNSLTPDRLARFIPAVTEDLRADLAARYDRKRAEFDELIAGITHLYNSDVLFEDDARAFVAERLLQS